MCHVRILHLHAEYLSGLFRTSLYLRHYHLSFSEGQMSIPSPSIRGKARDNASGPRIFFSFVMYDIKIVLLHTYCPSRNSFHRVFYIIMLFETVVIGYNGKFHTNQIRCQLLYLEKNGQTLFLSRTAFLFSFRQRPAESK